MNTFRFVNFQVYRDSKSFYQDILRFSDSIKNYSLRDQLQRAALSIVLNIAEGSAKQSDKDFGRYLQISIASVNEVVACLDIAHDIKLLNDDAYSSLLETSEDIAKQLGGFIKKLYSSSC